MLTEIDPAYLSQIEAARECVCSAGARLIEERQALFSKRPHQLTDALRAYNAAVDEHNVILDAVELETCGGYWDKPEAWRQSTEGQAYQEWIVGFEEAKIEPLDDQDARAPVVHIVAKEGDAHDVPDRLHIIQCA